MANSVEFEAKNVGDWNVVSFIGRVDTITAPQAEERSMEELGKTNKLALNLSQLSYISSAGLRVLLRLAKQSKKDGKEFAVCSVTGIVREVLEESGMDSLITLYDDESELK